MTDLQKGLKIAVIGAGAAGLTAAYLLSKEHHVSLFEKNKYFGGHANTITVEDEVTVNWLLIRVLLCIMIKTIQILQN